MKKTLITTSLIAALMAMPAMATQDEIDQKTVTSKYYVDQELATKQDTITTDRVVLFEGSGGDPDVTVPALVSFGTPDGSNGTDGLLGDKVGVLGEDIVSDYLGFSGISEFADDGGLENVPNMDNFVPTVRAVANQFGIVYNDMSGISDNIDTIVGDIGDIQGDITTINTTIETKQDKMTCAGYLAGHENDEDYCWLYSVASVTTQCLAYNETATSASQCCSGYLQSGLNKCGCNSASDCLLCNKGKTITCSATHECGCI